MTSKIMPADMGNTVYKVSGPGGGYFEADGKPSPYGGPGIRTPNTPKANGEYYVDSDKNKHFVQSSNPLSFSLKAQGDAKVLSFSPAGGTEKIVYLPYFQDNITSTVIPTNDPSVCYFITDELSGCNFYIDKLPDGNLVCHHANAKQYSPTEADLKANAGAFKQRAVDTMDEQHSNAVKSKYPEAVPLTKLGVADYYAKAQAAVDEKVREKCTDVQFYGGTTIMGFRVANKWEFWFQTYAQLPRYSKPTVFTFKSKGTQVKLGDEPDKIIEARCFWKA